MGDEQGNTLEFEAKMWIDDYSMAAHLGDLFYPPNGELEFDRSTLKRLIAMDGRRVRITIVDLTDEEDPDARL